MFVCVCTVFLALDEAFQSLKNNPNDAARRKLLLSYIVGNIGSSISGA